MDRRVMVILAEGFEEGETTTIIDVLRRAGFETHAVSLTGELVTGAHGMRLMADRILDSEGFRDYDMIVLPGGWGAADNMAADSRLTELLRWYAAQPEKYVAAMCAAPGVLAKAGITAGKTVTSYPGPSWSLSLKMPAISPTPWPLTITSSPAGALPPLCPLPLRWWISWAGTAPLSRSVSSTGHSRNTMTDPHGA